VGHSVFLSSVVVLTPNGQLLDCATIMRGHSYGQDVTSNEDRVSGEDRGVKPSNNIMGGMFVFVGKKVRTFGVNTMLLTAWISWCCMWNKNEFLQCQFALKKGQLSIAMYCELVCCNFSGVETSGPYLCPARH